MAGTTGSIRDKPGVGRTHTSFGGRRSCSLHPSHRPGRLEQRVGWQHPPGSRGSGRGPLLGCRRVGADGSTPGPGLSAPPSRPPLQLWLSRSMPLFCSPKCQVGPKATGGNQPMARVVQLPEASSRGRAPTRRCDRCTDCPKRPRSSGPCRTCGPMVGAAGGLSSSRWSAFRLGGVGGTLGGVSAGLRGGRGRSSPPLAWSVILTLSRTRGSRCSLVAAGTQGGTDRSWQPRDPRLPSSWGRGRGPHPASGCVPLSGARQSHPPAPMHPEPVPKPVGACSSPKLGSCGGRSALSPSVWAALSHRTCRARLVER